MPVILVLFKIIMFPSVIQAIFGAFLFWILIYLHEFFVRVASNTNSSSWKIEAYSLPKMTSAGKFLGTKMYYLAFER